MDVFQTDEVFGVVRGIPLNYVEREDVDDRFSRGIQKRRHIVLHGSSKQGKTVLRKHWLPSGQTIVVQCMSSWSLTQLHASMLKEAGFEVSLGSSISVTGKSKYLAKFTGAIKLPLFGETRIEASGSTAKEKNRSTQFKPLDLDLEDPNDVIRALASVNFSEVITLEDFHYLPEETQRAFAAVLKAYHERSSLTFVIVGVWLERDRLAVYNGDLSGRLLSVDVDSWPEWSLRRVIDKGETLLRITFDDDFKQRLIRASMESVYIVQDVCNAACIDSGVYQTSVEQRHILPITSAEQYVKDAVDRESARYRFFLTAFADGFRETQLQMYRWILLPVLVEPIENLKAGLRYRDIRNLIQRFHPGAPEQAELNAANIGFALKAVASLQAKHAIKPLVLDYDLTSDRLHVVDRGFLIWRENQDKNALLTELGLPDPAE